MSQIYPFLKSATHFLTLRDSCLGRGTAWEQLSWILLSPGAAHRLQQSNQRQFLVLRKINLSCPKSIPEGSFEIYICFTRAQTTVQ